MKLTASLQRQLRKALLTAFPIPGQINVVVGDAGMVDEYGTVIQFARFNPPGQMLDAAIDNLLQWVNANDYVVQFAAAAFNGAPKNPELKLVMASVGVLTDKYKALKPDPKQPSLGEAERLVFAGFQFEDVGVWLDDMARKRRAVCRIEPQPEVAGDLTSLDGYGTGFLVAPDVLMTNDHVAKWFYEDDAPKRAADVVCRFDYEIGADGKAINAGTEHKLHPTEWRLVRSPEAALDFALLKLEKAAGDDVVAGAARGFLTPDPYAFAENEGLVIIQHPMGAPLKLALGPVDQKPWEADRVTYRVNTLGGSSGSPCFTQERKVGALHHYGLTTNNRGVLQSSILKHLKGLPTADRQRLTDAGLGRLLG